MLCNQLSTQDKEKIMNFLQSLNFKEFLIDKELVDSFIQFAWAPCPDGELVTDHPRKLLNDRQFKVCPTIFLNTENEGSLFIIMKFPNIKINENKIIDIQYFNDCFEYYPYQPRKCSDLVKDKIKKAYNIQNELSIGLLDKVAADQQFVACSIEFANIISRCNKNVYYLWLKTFVKSPIWPDWCGIRHGDDVFYLFGLSLRLQSTISNSEKENILEFMKQYGKFIRDG